jgi:hypothetical protein
MKDTAMTGAAVVFIVSLFSFGIWWHVSVWNECRTDHSFMYCMSLISRK